MEYRRSPVRQVARWATGVAGLAAAMAGVVSALAWCAGSPMRLVGELGQASDFESLLVETSGLAAWAGLLWFSALIALHIGSAAPGALGAGCGWLARHAAPRFLQRAARGLIGLTMLTAPLISTPALAAQAGASQPGLDRPAVVASQAATATTAPTAADPNASPTPAAPAPLLDRPAAGYVPPRPPPPPPPDKIAAGTGGHLLTGVAHRDIADDMYVVRAGDALWDIAARHLGPDASATEIAREWPRWYAANESLIGPNPNLLLPGQLLRAPS